MRENSQAAGKTWTYTYDDGGNIQSKTEYAYTTGSLGAAVRTVAYGYGDASWSDLLTSIGGQNLTADEIGNLLSDGTWTYTWQHGRQLAGMSKSGTNIAYGYDSDGRRITKTVNGTAYNYHYLGDQLVELTWDGNKLHFTYDSTGPLSVNCNGTEYFYVKNAQGDVTGLVSASGTRVVTYTYDAWGNPLSTTGTMHLRLVWPTLCATAGMSTTRRQGCTICRAGTITRGGVGLSMRMRICPRDRASMDITCLHIAGTIRLVVMTSAECFGRRRLEEASKQSTMLVSNEELIPLLSGHFSCKCIRTMKAFTTQALIVGNSFLGIIICMISFSTWVLVVNLQNFPLHIMGKNISYGCGREIILI